MKVLKEQPATVALICAGLLMSGANPASATTVTFDWVQNPGSPNIATGSLSLTSSLLTPTDATGATQFNLTVQELAAVGETVHGDLSAFTFTFAGQTLDLGDFSSNGNTTGWADNSPGAPPDVLESTWLIVHQFPTPFLPVGPNHPPSLLDVSNGPSGALAETESEMATGQWQLRPVPLPAAGWLFLSAMGALVVFVRKRERPLLLNSSYECAAWS